MNLDYAVDRLYESGWAPAAGTEVETLANGRPFPSMESITREFEAAGLVLAIAHKPEFNCFRATWSPSDPGGEFDGVRRGTVIGTSAREAGVYALAQLRAGILAQV
jgi:hypothetical protein